MLSLKVLSLNIMGIPFNADNIWGTLFNSSLPLRHNKTAQAISALDPDIICLQEVLTYYQIRIFKKLLPSHPYTSFQNSVIGPKGGLVVFSKLPLIKQGFVEFKKNGTFRNKSFIWKLLKNGILITKLVNHPVILLNTHLTANFDWDWSLSNRFVPYLTSQLQQMKRTLEVYSDKNIVLSVGDFNMDRNTEIYKNFLKENAVTDIFADVDYTSMHEFYAQPGKEPPITDYIFLSKERYRVSVKEKNVVFKDKVTEGKKEFYLSDHTGLFVTVECNL